MEGKMGFMDKKHILVTGGAGFLGAHLCRNLLQPGNAMIAMDNLLTGVKDNIIEFIRRPYFQFIEQDIREAFDVPYGVDEIYNLACPASPIHYQKDSIGTIRTNVDGMRHVLELGKKYGAKVLQCSTSEVYGNPSVHPQTEGYAGSVHTIEPRACYDEGKRLAETLCYEYRRCYGVNTKIIRIFNTYGSGMQHDDGRAISNFICQALEKSSLTVYGDGKQTRSFCYVDDLVEGMIRMMETPFSVAGPINLGNPEEHTVLEVAEMVLRQTAVQLEMIYGDFPMDDPVRRRPDIARAREVLGWEPKVPLEEGLCFSFVYCADYGEVCEYEYDHVFLVRYSGAVYPNPEEIQDIKWVGMAELKEGLENHPEDYSVWFRIAASRVLRGLWDSCTFVTGSCL